MAESSKRDDLKEEYKILQGQYEDFDRRSLQIKGWIAAAAIAGVALGLDSTKNPHGEVWIVVAVIAGCIWYIEGEWKLFQYALADRIRIIEAYFRNDPEILVKDDALQPFQIYHWWFLSFVDDKPINAKEVCKGIRPQPHSVRLLHTMKQPFVCVPYLPIIVMCVIFLLIQLHR